MTRTRLLAEASSAELTDWVAFYRDQEQRSKPQAGAHRFDRMLTRGL